MLVCLYFSTLVIETRQSNHFRAFWTGFLKGNMNKEVENDVFVPSTYYLSSKSEQNLNM